MILTHDQIIEAHKRGEVVIEPFDGGQVGPASYDLRVGPQGVTTTTKKLVDLKEAGFLVLDGGDFGVVTTFETLKLGPQYAARLGLRAKYARRGLIATTGAQIDPGFYGRLIVGLTNLTPKSVSLGFRDDFLTVEFHRLEQATTQPYKGPYQGKTSLEGEDIAYITETEAMSLSEMLVALRSLSQNVASLAGEMKFLKWVVPVMLGAIALIVGAIPVILVLKH